MLRHFHSLCILFSALFNLFSFVSSGERPFKCPIEGCGRSFTTSNIRKVHIRTHTGERPYYCTEPGCGRAFASATNYKNHVRIHTGNDCWCLGPVCLSRLPTSFFLPVHKRVSSFKISLMSQHMCWYMSFFPILGRQSQRQACNCLSAWVLARVRICFWCRHYSNKGRKLTDCKADQVSHYSQQ